MCSKRLIKTEQQEKCKTSLNFCHQYVCILLHFRKESTVITPKQTFMRHLLTKALLQMFYLIKSKQLFET